MKTLENFKNYELNTNEKKTVHGGDGGDYWDAAGSVAEKIVDRALDSWGWYQAYKLAESYIK